TWELPEQAARWVLEHAGLSPTDLDAVGYSYDPGLAPDGGALTDREWEDLRTLYVRRAPRFLASALPGLEPGRVRFVPHHVAHAASTYLASPFDSSAVMVLDGRGERASSLLGHAVGDHPAVLAIQELPHSLGLLYERLTEHVGFHRSADEYKVMALASYGRPVHLDALRRAVRTTDGGGFHVDPIDLGALVPPCLRGAEPAPAHADLAASVQVRLEEVILELATWLHRQTGERAITLAGGVALNCVANSRLQREGPFDHVWVQPAAGDAGTALGAALATAADLGDAVAPMATAAL